jgi:7,8-dihydropterin-6-yl-methyl-4-(beta-D-ribofuranosyl)aminobenzene 5'-phosphate synthase
MEPVIEETVNRLKQFAPRVIMPMHCTGWNALRRLQSEFPESFVLSSVGTRLVVPRDE